ncbi:MAG TPA: ROK family protein [Pyrinomonadaceae bacterium]|jgi:predicted NBD/HSP70 family sugar kinase
MTLTIGVLATEHIAVGLVEGHRLVGALRRFPADESAADQLGGMPAQEIVAALAEQIAAAAEGRDIAAVGVGFPGVIRDGVVEDSPNLHQVKGQKLRADLTALLGARGFDAPVEIVHDADALAAGLAATRAQLDRVIRVWALMGNGVGFGRYPIAEGYWEGGHSVVTLDPKENFCGCGGRGHLEGIMGNNAIRRRFLDLEPEEVFLQAREGDERCVAFVKLYHRALAAATATNIHMEGPGQFFISGPNARYVQLNLLEAYLHDMIKMSPLQGSQLEIVSSSDQTVIVGAAVSAAQTAASAGDI